MYCENCRKIIENSTCPECGRAGRLPEPLDAVFLGEKGHPWSDMLCDVLGQEGIPCLRTGSLGAGMMMTIGHYLDMESVYVPYDRLEKAQEIFDSLFGAAAMPAVSEEEEDEEEDEW